MVLCPTPGCDAVLRCVPGLHQAGEPYMQSDEAGMMFMVCLKCGARVPWLDPYDEPRSPQQVAAD